MGRWPNGYFQDFDGSWWYSAPGASGRERAKLSKCSVCQAEFPIVAYRQGLYCSKSCGSRGKGRPPSVRPDLFSTWTAAESWLAGLIWADGTLQESKGHLRVALHSTDRDLIDQAGQIAGLTPGTRIRKDGRKPLYYIQIGSRHVVTRLIAHGLRQHKSLTCQWPQIPGHVAAFIRGYFDGDGSVGLYRNPRVKSASHQGRLLTSFVGSQDFINVLQANIQEHVGTRLKRLRIHRSGMHYLGFNHGESLRVAAFMYADNGPHLHRKAAVIARGATLDPRRFPLPDPWPDVLSHPHP